MLRRRITITLFTALAMIAGLGSGVLLGASDVASAQDAGPQQIQAALGTAFTYQGRLTDDQDNPLDGPYDLEFRLYDGVGGAVNAADGDAQSAHYATVAGGQGNTADGAYTTVGGGRDNVAGDFDSVVGGGVASEAHEIYLPLVLR